MELRPRKGRSVQTPSTPTPTPTPTFATAKPSSRLPPQSSSRKKRASVPFTPIHIPSDNEDEDPKEIPVDLVDGATEEIHAEEEVTLDECTRKQGNRDISLSDNIEFETPLSSIARLRRAHIKGLTLSKTEVTSTNKKKKKMARVLGSAHVADTSITYDRIAATPENVGLGEAMAEKLSGIPSEDVASAKIEKQEAFTGIVLQKSDELAVEIDLLAPQEVCIRNTEVLSPRIDSKHLHSSVKKSRKKRDEKSSVDDAKLDQDGHVKNIDDADAPIVSESQGLFLILSDDEAVQVSDHAVQVDGCEKKVSARKEATLENRVPGAESSKVSRESKKSELHKKDIVEEELGSRKLFEETSDVTIPCMDTKFDDQGRHELGLIAHSSKEGVQESLEELSDEAASPGEEREGDINGDHAKLDTAAASSQKSAAHDKECSSSNDDDGTVSSGSDDDDNEEDEMASAFFSSMKANLQRISEPSGLSLQKDEQAKQDALVRLESQFTNFAVKKPCTNGGSTGYGLSWSPEIALSSLKTSKAQVGKPRSAVEARPDTIWGKDRCLQDGLCVPPVNPLKLNKLARKQKDDTAGAKWFNLSAPTITPEIKKELQLVKLRGALDPKRHYKADDSKGLPKYFQVGTVVGGPADFYSGRLTKKEQKSSLASELLSNSSLTAYRKRKYLEIQEQKQAGGKGFWKKKKSKRTPAWANI